MQPAFSVIFLTTLIGAGQGLFLALYGTEVGARIGWLPAPGPGFYVAGSVLVGALLVLGLVASVFHLGRPERGWRAASRWRTSWLSREVIVLPAFVAAVVVYGAAHWAAGTPLELPLSTLAIGAVTTLLAFALFLCTGMVYACIKFLQEWASPLTVVNYLLLGCASGFTLATAYAAVAEPGLTPIFGVVALALIAAALATRAASLVRNARLKPRSTLQSAIGIKHPRIVQKAQGMMGGAFNTREFFHGRSRALLRSVKWAFLLLVFPVPATLLIAGLALVSPALLAAAFVIQYLGLLAERWFFFAQANHPQNLYYQAVA
ncbi:MAG TPA: dimethyl sulfoxide reductase anchor subunit [Burkholderiaceae bacterium]|nr:dimethyl sulfoxide reductase anchor subunit [Burkholderiaceae bacterium]HQR71488.1 dimethyl sulfoxide reductase anchor subunit [Burkholderiaceae bacterium]